MAHKVQRVRIILVGNDDDLQNWQVAALAEVRKKLIKKTPLNEISVLRGDFEFLQETFTKTKDDYPTIVFLTALTFAARGKSIKREGGLTWWYRPGWDTSKLVSKLEDAVNNVLRFGP